MPRTRADTEETRRTILRAAHDLFTKLGYRAVTMRMVAEASGVTHPLLYYHFADKEALFLEVQREQGANDRAAFERIAARKNTSLADRLVLIVRYLNRSSPQNMGLFFHEFRHELSPATQSALAEIFQSGVFKPISDLFEEGIRTGFLQSPEAGGASPLQATFLLLNLAASLSTVPPIGNEHTYSNKAFGEKRDDATTMVVHTLIYGLAARPAGESSS
ncbi:MAG TPA: TetR/AcrR family transcriptional regulator [Ktedonobacteraceae bacterium]|nr:TetR/AcrR family transcriptional regulator [Ktedonobacteraceae bacterium]